LRVPWTARRSNQSILKEISPEYSLAGLMLKLKLQYFGHLMRRADSFLQRNRINRIYAHTYVCTCVCTHMQMHVVWSLSIPRYSVCRPENQESRVGCCPSLEPEKTKLQLREHRASAQHILTCPSSVPSGSHEAGRCHRHSGWQHALLSPLTTPSQTHPQ